MQGRIIDRCVPDLYIHRNFYKLYVSVNLIVVLVLHVYKAKYSIINWQNYHHSDQQEAVLSAQRLAVPVGCKVYLAAK